MVTCSACIAMTHGQRNSCAFVRGWGGLGLCMDIMVCSSNQQCHLFKFCACVRVCACAFAHGYAGERREGTPGGDGKGGRGARGDGKEARRYYPAAAAKRIMTIGDPERSGRGGAALAGRHQVSTRRRRSHDPRKLAAPAGGDVLRHSARVWGGRCAPGAGVARLVLRHQKGVCEGTL